MQFDAVSVQNYCDAWGSPLYVFDEDSFVKNYRRFEAAFKSIYSKYKVSYSFKTNYAPYICRLVRDLGGYAEVVSDMELTIARAAGYQVEHIVYNGPCKGPMLEDFILCGGMANVDNFEELGRIIAFAKQNADRELRIGIRVNIDIGQDFISRFGIDEKDLDSVFKAVKRTENVRIIGIHCHIGRSRSIEAWKNRTVKMMEIADRLFAEQPVYISLGSGMYGEMAPSLACQFGMDLPEYKDYAEAVARPFAEHYPGESKPILFTEPGTTLINKYISFISTVTAVKHIKGKDFIVLDGSKHNLGEICELKQLPIQMIGYSEGETVYNADFVGYTCLEHDVLYKNYTGKVAVGDRIVFDNTGGYSNVSKPPFIKPNCYMVSSNGNIIKRAEKPEEVMCTYE